MKKVRSCCSLACRELAIVLLFARSTNSDFKLLHQVDFNVRNDYEFVGNYKVLQEGFTKSGVKKVSELLVAY